MIDFIVAHFDTMLTVTITVLGFAVTYFMTKRNFIDEVRKEKITHTAAEIQTLPYEICQMMNEMIKGKNSVSVEKYGDMLSRILVYGSKDSVKIAIRMQRQTYKGNLQSNADKSIGSEQCSLLAAYALFITQLKYDLTSEIISPESWFELRITDYQKMQPAIKEAINALVQELQLNKAFKV